MNIMPLTPFLTCSLIPACEESNNPNKVLNGLSNQQMRKKLQRDGSNPGPPAKPNSDNMFFFMDKHIYIKPKEGTRAPKGIQGIYKEEPTAKPKEK